MSLDLRKEVALKPCPFGCGPVTEHIEETESLWSHAIVPWLTISCSECDVMMTSEVHEELREKWNRRAPDPQLSDLTVRIAELEAGVSKIARGDVPPEKEGHYLAHREAVRIARALLSPAVEGGGGERNMASRELSTTTNAAPSASGLADPTSSGAE